jgi:hypothetical protein
MILFPTEYFGFPGYGELVYPNYVELVYPIVIFCRDSMFKTTTTTTPTNVNT